MHVTTKQAFSQIIFEEINIAYISRHSCTHRLGLKPFSRSKCEDLHDIKVAVFYPPSFEDNQWIPQTTKYQLNLRAKHPCCFQCTTILAISDILWGKHFATISAEVAVINLGNTLLWLINLLLLQALHKWQLKAMSPVVSLSKAHIHFLSQWHLVVWTDGLC